MTQQDSDATNTHGKTKAAKPKLRSALVKQKSLYKSGGSIDAIKG